MALLEVSEISKEFDGNPVLREASFSVDQGAVSALIGPNGAGKTTLFNVISGFHTAERGSVMLGGKRIDGLSPHGVARHGLGRTFQSPKVLTRMTVMENLMLGGSRQPGEALWQGVLRRRRVKRREAELHERAKELLELVSLEKHASAYAATLSGGQRKLLEFARVLMSDPSFIMLDEPMAGVNPTLGGQLLAHVRQLCAERGLTFLFIEHDMAAVMANSDDVQVMSQGTIIARGSPAAVRADPRVIEAYFGGQVGTGRSTDVAEGAR